MTTESAQTAGESQARRLERVYEDIARLLRDPGLRSRLRTSPGGSEWSSMQTLGHVTEMIPYWLAHCRTLIAATGAPPSFGRTHGSPERLAGIAHGASADPDALLRQLHEAVTTAAGAIRRFTAAERARRGVSTERGEMTVGDAVEAFIVAHAEEHLAQVQAALRGSPE